MKFKIYYFLFMIIPILHLLVFQVKKLNTSLTIDGVTVGRQLEENDIMLVDIPASHAKKLRKMDLSAAEEEVLEELIEIHRKDDHFWGR